MVIQGRVIVHTAVGINRSQVVPACKYYRFVHASLTDTHTHIHKSCVFASLFSKAVLLFRVRPRGDQNFTENLDYSSSFTLYAASIRHNLCHDNIIISRAYRLQRRRGHVHVTSIVHTVYAAKFKSGSKMLLLTFSNYIQLPW